MPVIRNYQCDMIPEWSELKLYEKYYVNEGETIEIDTGYSKAAVFVYAGYVRVQAENKGWDLCSAKPGHAPIDFIQLNTGKFTVSTKTFPGFWLSGCEIFVLSGDWKGWTVVSNFMVENSKFPENNGDPMDCETHTTFENHFHDFDECWIVACGGGKVWDNEQLYDVYPGDMVITKRGTHHCFVECSGFTRCVAFKSRIGGNASVDNLYVIRGDVPMKETIN